MEKFASISAKVSFEIENVTIPMNELSDNKDLTDEQSIQLVKNYILDNLDSFAANAWTATIESHDIQIEQED